MKKSKNIYLFIILNSLSLSSCSLKNTQNKISTRLESLLPIQQQVFNMSVSGGEYEKGYYLLSEKKGELYYIKDNISTFVNYTYYADGTPSTPGTLYNNYDETVSGGYGFYCLNDKIYTISIYHNKDGAMNYHLIQIDPNGKNYNQLLQLDYAPDGRFVINQDKIYIYERKENGGIIHIYDLQGKELSNIISDEDIRFFVDGKKDKVFILGNNRIYYINKDLDGLTELFTTNSNEYVMFISRNHYLSLEYTYDENQNPISCRSYYRNLESQQIELTFENEAVFQFDNQYIYSSQVSGTQTYKLYDLSGNLVKEIIPSQSLGTPEGETPTVMFWNSDFNTITYIMNGTDIISDYATEPIQCNIESGSCQYILSN